MKFDVRLKFVSLSLLISMCEENLYVKMEKLEAQIFRYTIKDRGLKLCPDAGFHIYEQNFKRWYSKRQK